MSIEDLTAQKAIFDFEVEEGSHFIKAQANSISEFMGEVISLLTIIKGKIETLEGYHE